MAGTIFGIPFDEELFLQMYREAPDPVLTAMIQSGAVVEDPVIAGMIQSHGNFYTIPFYDVLDGDPQNYDGQTDIEASEVGGGVQSGIVYGRAKAFFARNFTAELSGADPMGHIASTIAKYWQKQRQKYLIGILTAIFDCTPTNSDYADGWEAHTLDTSAQITAVDFNNLATQACGDHKDQFGLAIMHSNVAKVLENMQVLEYWKYTDAYGIQRPMNIASANGYTVIVDDMCPYDSTGGTYESYLLGTGCIRNAKGRVDIPIEPHRDPLTNGGQDYLITRMRETLHPNGFCYTIPTDSWTESPTDAQLTNSANWDLKFNPKAIPIARLITTA